MRPVITLLVVGCAATPGKSTPSAPESVASPAPATARVEPAGDPWSTANLVDTSTATIWGVREPTPEPGFAPTAPVAADPDDTRHVATPVARARKPGKRAPCFPGRDVLVATEIYSDLYRYATFFGSDEPPPPPIKYGTCTMNAGTLRDARGTVVAEVHCGVTVHVPGVVDSLGFEVGDSGKDVLAALPKGDDGICWGDTESETRCWFVGDDEVASVHYTVGAVSPNAGQAGPLRGAATRTFFAKHTIAHFTQRMTCH